MTTQTTFDFTGEDARPLYSEAPRRRLMKPAVTLPANLQTATKDGNAKVRKAPPCDVDKLRELLAYDPVTGDLRWLPRPWDKRWTARHAGKIALTTVALKGIRKGKVFEKALCAHRVAFALHHDQWPEREIIARNGDLTDIRADNLLLASPSIIAQRRAKHVFKNNTSGHPGVSLDKSTGRWVARIKIAGRRFNLGTFDTPEDAAKARHRVEAMNGLTAAQIEARIASV